MRRAALAFALLFAFGAAAMAQQKDARAGIAVKYIASGVIYLAAGRNEGLGEGQTLVLRRAPAPAKPGDTPDPIVGKIVGEVVIVSVADSSAVCEVRSEKSEIQIGDLAFTSEEDALANPSPKPSANVRHVPALISFTTSDPLDQEIRDTLPKPPLKEINRARGRVGLEYSQIAGRDASSPQSRQLGLVIRIDMTRMFGTYWNISGYWRGRLNSRSSSGSSPTTLNDLLQRTYHLALTYSNPNSRWTAGVGRLFVPWATSQGTLDGGYLGHRVGGKATLAAFAGSTPDPTSWNYDPDRRIAGALLNFEQGSFGGWRMTSTTGVAVTTIRWRSERRYAFLENSLFYKQKFSVYQALEADAGRTLPDGSKLKTGVSRSYVTFRVQPVSRLTLDLSHNYFADIPTFDSQLVGTGLVDQLLFQGLNGGARLELPGRITLYGNLGRSSQTGDTRPSWNNLYGVTFGNIPRTGLRLDLRYSKFDSSFGRGHYRSVSLSRHVGDDFRFEVQVGLQNFSSAQTVQSQGRFVNSNVDWFISRHYFLQAGYTWQRGNSLNYDQWILVFGRRF